MVGIDSVPAVNVKVLNLVSEKTAVSDANGEFSIEAKTDELLVFPSENFEYKRYLIKEGDAAKKQITIVMIPKPIQLDDVVVLRSINPEDLGLVPKGQKRYTVAERRLRQAGINPHAAVGGSGTAGFALSVDGIINSINGRSKMLKKNLVIERTEARLVKFRSMFADDYFTEKLHIRPEMVEGFRYYVIDDPKFIAALKTNVKAKIEFCLVGMAQKYNELNDETE
ncbi:hypothetical protein [Flavobacterium selenitireducens]|uniref:hypothetical protein n=1 Tax=Flavobacterium selenitireducens TaxID=2722704 RepID=UPI00168AFA82|nr:hypothetical protein [Flavobacterium selenitireducens]MBD3583251.1 hypothetical protein [Flavobacterium selenitireducens]